MSAATPEGILRAVEAQRIRLINVVGVVEALKIAARDEPPKELEGGRARTGRGADTGRGRGIGGAETGAAGCGHQHGGRAVMKTRKPSRKPRADSPETWPIVWRVAMPAAGSFNHDMTMLETTDEAEARRIFGNLRRVRYPVRLERVSCGPLPKGARKVSRPSGVATSRIRARRCARCSGIGRASGSPTTQWAARERRLRAAFSFADALGI